MKYTVSDLQKDFPDDDACLEWLVGYLYPDGIKCFTCRKITKHYKVTGRKAYACANCGRHRHPTGGTIWHKSRTPLTLWFYAMFLMANTRSGISAAQLQRETGVTYKTAWRMMHQIRILMNNENVKFTKEVEMDETFIHANTFKRSSARRRYGFDARRTGETVFGIVERGGSVRVWHIDGANATTIMPIIKQHVPKGAIVHTDGWSTYNRLPKIGYQHRWTNHSKLEFYTEHSSTQNIENVWSHFKRGIKGVYRHIGRKYIQAYANEFAWRYNHRNSISSFWALMGEFSLLS